MRRKSARSRSVNFFATEECAEHPQQVHRVVWKGDLVDCTSLYQIHPGQVYPSLLPLIHTWPTSFTFSLTLAPSLSLSLLLTYTGISGKSQVLFALVFTTRYLDIFTNFVSVYNSVMKVIFIVTAYGTLYLMFVKFKATYDSNHDTFRAEFLVIPAIGLAMLVNHEFSAMEVSMERK